MEVFVLFQAVYVLSCMIVNTEAELSLTVISPLGESTINDLNIPKDFECNAEVTLVCEVKPYTDSVIWQINGHTYALCIYQDCFTYPPFPENHTFSMDLASDVFNLTMNPVTTSTNNNIYKCDDGITARSVKATVKVYPTNETLEMDTTAEDRITVTTGCVYPNGIGDVTFEWYISKYNETLEPELFTSKKNESTVIFDCTETPSCTVEDTSHFNNTVVFDDSDDGEEYYIYVIIKHNDAPNRPPTIQSTGRTYKVKEKDGSSGEDHSENTDESRVKDGGLAPGIIAVIVIASILVVIIIIIVIVVAIRYANCSKSQVGDGKDVPLHKQTAETVQPQMMSRGEKNVFSTRKPLPKITKQHEISHGHVYIDHGEAHIFGMTIHLPFGNRPVNRLSPIKRDYNDEVNLQKETDKEKKRQT